MYLPLKSVILLVSASFALFLSFILLQIQTKNKPNRYLSLFVSLISILIFQYAFALAGIQIPYLSKVIETGWFLLGPFFYFYLNAYLSRSIKRSYLHFLTYIIFLFFAFWKVNEVTMYSSYINAAQSFIYLLFSFLRLKDSEKGLKMLYSGDQVLLFLWMKRISFSFASYIILDTIFAIILLFDQNYYENYVYISLLSLSLFILYIAYHVILNQRFFNIQTYTESKNYLSDAELERIGKRIEAVVNEEKLFLNPKLRLSDLVEKANSNRNNVSLVLNNYFHQSFYDYINQFRVNYAIRLIQDDSTKHLNLLAISEESGFNSKASFNRAFKYFTQKTPKEFLT